ncbi:MAG: hypothetical protein ABJE77_10430 [Tateyamaria sp.]
MQPVIKERQPLIDGAQRLIGCKFGDACVGINPGFGLCHRLIERISFILPLAQLILERLCDLLGRG